jgi:hypothetical protein
MALPEWTYMPDNQPTVVPLDENAEPPWAALS